MPIYFLETLFNPTTLLGAIFYAAVIFIAASIAGRVLHLAIRRYLDRATAAGVDSTSIRFVGQLLRGIVYIIALLFYAHVIPALHSLGTTWLASIGIVSVVIGLATQSTLSNLVAGISLILYRPFRIGDRIQIATPAGPEIGLVESIDLGYTSLRTPDRRRIVLPNSIVTNQTHINFSRNSPRVLVEISITISEGDDIGLACKILLEVAKEVPKISKINGCFVASLSSQGTVLNLSIMCIDPGDVAQIKSNVLEHAKKQFAAAGIKIA
jgi:small-conductance mechanosensitive channel